MASVSGQFRESFDYKQEDMGKYKEGRKTKGER